jgi:hypothetical protein
MLGWRRRLGVLFRLGGKLSPSETLLKRLIHILCCSQPSQSREIIFSSPLSSPVRILMMIGWIFTSKSWVGDSFKLVQSVLGFG